MTLLSRLRLAREIAGELISGYLPRFVLVVGAMAAFNIGFIALSGNRWPTLKDFVDTGLFAAILLAAPLSYCMICSVCIALTARE